MAGKKKKKAPVRPVVSLRVRPAMYEDLVREANERRIKLSEEVERRLIRYEELDANKMMEEMADDTILGASLTGIKDDVIDKLAERIAKKLKQLKPE
jgi:hypothetical protein